MQFEIAVTNGLNSHEFEVHAAGCPDVARKVGTVCSHVYSVEALNAAEAVDDEVADYEAQDQGFGHADFKVLPCARGGGA